MKHPSPEETAFTPEGPSRRQVLAAGALGAMAMWAAGDSAVMHSVWPDGELQLEILPDKHMRTTPGEGMVVVPGVGGTYGRGIAESVQRFSPLPPGTPIAGVIYPNKSYTLDQLAYWIKWFGSLRRVDRLGLFGDSFGGPSGLVAAGMAGKPIERIIFNCSPFDIDDANFGEVAHLAARANLPPLVTTKFITTLFKAFQSDGGQNSRRELATAWHETFSGASPELIMCQIKILDQLRLNPKDFKDTISDKTMAIFAMPRDLNSDRVVKDLQAYQKYQQFFYSLGVELHVAYMDWHGHADTTQASISTAGWVKKTNLALAK